MAEPEYIRKDVFDIHVKNLRERDEADERITDIRFEQMKALIMATQEKQDALMSELKDFKAEFKDFKKEVIGAIAELKMDNVNLRSEVKEEMSELRGEVRGDLKATNARLDALQTKFSWQLTLLGVLVAAVIAIVQRLWQ